ncbi:MAG: hypothetical protein M5U21_04280 [Fimbriimonadaceae bacterium]|nr:hypothetical protein [Fimbriimonadaceae bacterium]
MKSTAPLRGIAFGRMAKQVLMLVFEANVARFEEKRSKLYLNSSAGASPVVLRGKEK